MRYFFLGWFLIVVAALAILGFRGGVSTRPPLEIFPDMDRQAKLRPQTPNAFFSNGRSSQLPVAGTIPRSVPYRLAPDDANSLVYPHQDVSANTGFIPGTTNYVEVMPMALTSQLLARGRDRFEIYCSACHGRLGDGRGITTRFGMAVIRNLHEPRIVAMTDGELFAVVSQGRGLMGAYAAMMDVPDRWAAIAYLRALQMSRLGTTNDVPAPFRAALNQ